MRKLSIPLGFPELFLASSLLAVGLFYEALSCASSVVLSAYLLYILHKNKCLMIRLNLPTIAVFALSAFSLLGTLWAADPGMALIGFLKFLPLPLFATAVMQQKEKRDYLAVLPSVMVFMTVISAIVMFFSPRNEYFAPAGRLSGFLQYSNTFALLLLLSIIITVLKEKPSKADYAFLPVLILGIILSGSRTVFVLTALMIVLLIIFARNKRLRLFLLGVTVLAVSAGAIYAFVTGNFDTIGRFLTTSLGESTFIGRLLYDIDALPIVLKNPFGTGYLGFCYLQQGVQTGLYSVRYVHNDFLQIFLDFGWIPGLLWIAAAARAFFRKGAGLRKRLLIFTLSAHCFFDFDLEFVAVFMILWLLLDDGGGGKEYRRKPPRSIFTAFGLVSLYMLVPLALSVFNANHIAQALYPWNTDVNLALLAETDDPAEADKRATLILKQNKNIAAAYSAKAAYAFSQGDFQNVVMYQDRALEKAPLLTEEYESYLYMMIVGRELYQRAGDAASAEYCDKKANEILRKFGAIKGRLSDLGKRIDDQPRTELSEELKRYLENPESALG